MEQDQPWSRLSSWEERLRDRITGPLVCWLPRWLKPTHLTLGRAGLAAVAIGLSLAGDLLTLQATLLLLAAASDSLDGTLARLRRQTSRLGGLLDGVVDWVVGVWMAWLVFWGGLLSYWVAVWLAAAQGVTMATDSLRRRRLRRPAASWPPWQHTTLARLQGVGVILGCFLLLVGVDRQAPGLQCAGRLLVCGGLALSLVQAGWGLALLARRRVRLDDAGSGRL
ncbi:MAG: CDP-alcohol phosphatidyltransferase family protein [Acetobacteraceae bacterium]|nr:CDP-alcohol phosphatidyltransferase family protein [Acetobacteraceae bacterium]